VNSIVRPIRWGLIGASTIASTYMVRALREARGGELVAVLSGDPSHGAAFASRHGIPEVYSSLDDLLGSDSLDAVYISSVNSRHRDQAVAAAAAGLHVLCDKPLAIDVAGAESIIRACSDRQVVLGVNHNLRCSPVHIAVRELIADGRLGRVLAARVLHLTLPSPELRPWRTQDPAAGGGAALDITVHDADILRFLLGQEPTEVTAFTGTQAGDTVGVDDAIAAVLRFADGVIATIHDSLSVPFSRSSLSIHGDQGSVYLADAMSDDPIATATLTDASGTVPVPLPPTDGLYHGIVAAFTDSVHGNGSPAATGLDGLRAVAIATAALQSAGDGQTVAIPPIGGGRGA
jgi:1,5-anhydro-D-fructose reductase (1,5-anhydro-D-mannitol-forming)